MNNIPAWAQITLTGLGFLVAGLSVLWFFARRALLADDEESGLRPSRPRKSIMRRIEARLIRLLLRPPQWRQVQPYVLGVLAATLGGCAVWAIWSHVSSWFSSPPVVQHAAPPTGLGKSLPWESAVDHLTHSTAMFASVIGLLGMLLAGASILVGEGRRAYLGLSMVFGAIVMGGAPRLFDTLTDVGDASISQPSSASTASSSEDTPADIRNESHFAPAVATSPDSTAAVESDPAARDDDAPAVQATAPAALRVPAEAEQVEGVQGEASAPSPHHDRTTSRDGHFGVGDALMMYGAYRLLTHDSEPRAPTVIYAPSPARLLPTPPVAPPTAARSQTAQSQHVSTPSPAPTYKPSTVRVSAIRTAPVRSTPVFRSSGRRSR